MNRHPIRQIGQFLVAQTLMLWWINAVCAYEIPFRPVLKDITAGDIQLITQDSSGYLWVGGRHALLRYNTYEFQEIFIASGEDGNAEPASLRTATGVVEDKRGNLWVSSYQGLFLLDADTEKLKKVRPLDNSDEPLYSQSVYSLPPLPSGDLVLGTNAGIAIMQHQTRKLESIDLSDRLEGFENNTVNTIVVQNEQTVWLGARTGLFLLNPVTRELKHFLPSPNSPSKPV